MGEIRVNIPKDIEAAFDEAFPGEDKAAAVLALIQTEIARRQDADATGEDRFEELVAEVQRLRNERPYFTDEDIRSAREELRK